ncbi:MAG: cell envelope integrity protein CreD [Pseudomonadota bacterium]
MSEQSFLMDRATRFGIMCALVVLMFVPLIFIALIIEERAGLQQETLREIADQWGGQQMLAGPVLIVPVEREVVEETREGDEVTRTTRTENAPPLIVTPRSLAIDGVLRSELRARGIFEVPVYSTDLTLAFGFDLDDFRRELGESERLDWPSARIELHLTKTRGLRSAVEMMAGEEALAVEPGSMLPRKSGVHAPVAQNMALNDMTLVFTLNGARDLEFAPVGRQTDIALSGDWPHPSFDGAFLPDEREVSDSGFTASWSIPHLARDLPQMVRGVSAFNEINASRFGLSLYNPVGFYQKVGRAARYGILFIALTFLTIFLTEGMSKRPVHPAQYLLIGVAQCVFFLLLLSFAEQIGFTPAYMLASLATIALLAFYAVAALRLGKRAGLLIGVLVLLYATLFLILQSTEYALLAGSILAFLAVAVTMVLTRNEVWFPQKTDAGGAVKSGA